ncbi:leucyl aminopeptidase [Lichenifustis flavocetrariae]|uniref:Probable cytosol aminopeptidase n=1 Tax=Lichenifustis flavocetrariae TaxID=2949735 RepID=A0AA41YVH6_9HYPH|nr:leucyl aminopeptidase [Lichenifustis flavocetrariae]MCW6508070.1 leucyl aminopeptidase [Lichenifustis flavocetrariae]
MPDLVEITFTPLGAEPSGGTLVCFVGKSVELQGAAARSLPGAAALVTKAAEIAQFKGKPKSVLDLLAPSGLAIDRLLVVGAEDEKPWGQHDWVTLGGFVMGKLRAGTNVTVILDLPGADTSAVASFALGLKLRAYRFDQYKSKKADKADKTDDGPIAVAIAVKEPEAARAAGASLSAIAGGVYTARSLVNEPPNVLFPKEFARRAAELQALGVEIEVLDQAALEKIGMRALLAVGQGSRNESRVVVMRWNGGAAGQKPVAVVGKGVTFDTGGISIKPAAGMEDMKGDMAGAACVVGLMQALASRKAKANVVGAIGLVENMPDGNAQRPGDIVTALSGTTIEIINTDAEGRLVLADVLWYVQSTYQPAIMIDLATLTGAIIVALAHEYAGMFSNSDELSERLVKAGQETGERVWRLPLGPTYDKLIESKFADIKNTGGRHGGSITAAQFLQRFVNEVPWAHLDIAGTGMGSPVDEINQSWGSGWGVRLLDRLVADHYEG